MAFVRCDDDNTWVSEQGLIHCPQLPRIASTDTPYLMFDFSNVLAEDNLISSASAIIEVDSKTITIADTSVSTDSQFVSFKVSGMGTGNFLLRSEVTLVDGTTNVKSIQGTLRVIA